MDRTLRPYRALRTLAAVALLCAAPAIRSEAAVAWGASPATTVDTTAPVLALDPVPANLILRGGQQLAFHWTTGDSHPGTATNDFTAEVQDTGVPVASFSYLATPTDASWDWTAPEMQSGYLSLLVTCRDAFGNTTTARTGDFSVVLSSSGTPVTGLPASPVIEGNRPNPCNPGTTVRFSLPRAGRACLELYAADGALQRRLVDGEFSAGPHDVFWDGRDDQGRDLASGTYLLRMRAGGAQQVRKVSLIR